MTFIKVHSIDPFWSFLAENDMVDLKSFDLPKKDNGYYVYFSEDATLVRLAFT